MVDLSGGRSEARYANHFGIGQNEFEFIFEFGQFHAQQHDEPPVNPEVPIVRIVMAPPIAMALAQSLRRAIAEHEHLYGAIDQS